ncbi:MULTISPECIES: hypothetical protein [unclassified Anabaena]|uniref:hypothetical protein n=1 Tax=unclassified Anabaena TaxID=2619674 RepID=UPI0039C6CB81
MSIRLVHIAPATILLLTFWGCTVTQSNQTSPGNSTGATPTPIQSSYNSKSDRPETKTATISIEGEETPINLRLYQEYSQLFTTYYPDEDFISEGVSSGEGTGVRFISNFDGNKNEDAYVSFSFLNSFQTLEQLRNFVNGASGLIASNGWQIVNQTQDASYPWSQEQIVFREGQDITGVIYLGEQNGKVFYAVTHYPLEYGDGFAPRADFILQNLQVSE